MTSKHTPATEIKRLHRCNRELNAAALDLLAALKRIAAEADNGRLSANDDELRDWLMAIRDTARAAIAKATGNPIKFERDKWARVTTDTAENARIFFGAPPDWPVRCLGFSYAHGALVFEVLAEGLDEARAAIAKATGVKTASQKERR